VDAAITTVDADAWTAIHYPNAFVDEDTGELISDAEVAEIPYTAFGSRPKKWQVRGRLIVRRVKRLNPHTPSGQGELFDLWRHHAVFTTSPYQMLQAETQHRSGHVRHSGRRVHSIKPGRLPVAGAGTKRGSIDRRPTRSQQKC
jgi:hypothetical protein